MVDKSEQIPVPDPTELTTQQLSVAIDNLRELVFTRLDGMDKAIELFNNNMTRVPTDTDKQISHLKGLHEETFKVVDQKFNVIDEKVKSISHSLIERDVRIEQTRTDSKEAINAALNAAEKAVAKQNEAFTAATNKSETNITKQIDQIGTLISVTNGARDKEANDMKERLTLIEGRTNGINISESKSSEHKRDNSAMVMGIIAAIFGFLGIVGMIITLIITKR